MQGPQRQQGAKKAQRAQTLAEASGVHSTPAGVTLTAGLGDMTDGTIVACSLATSALAAKKAATVARGLSCTAEPVLLSGAPGDPIALLSPPPPMLLLLLLHNLGPRSSNMVYNEQAT